MTTIATAARRHALSRPLVREAVTEFVATAFLLIAVVGSGIMAERLCGGNVGLALLANAIATGGALVALILAFGPQTGAHMNPVVTLAAAATEGLRWQAAPAYIAAQVVGAILGVWLAHIMFDLPIWQLSQHARTGLPQWVAEVIATFGLLTVIWGCRAHHQPVTAFAVGAYITGAYWFTASTSFANPAVTVARALRTPSPASVRWMRQALSWHRLQASLSRCRCCGVLYRRAKEGMSTLVGLRTRTATAGDAAAIAVIYNEGIADRIATFETEPRTPVQIAAWFDRRHTIIIAETDETGPVAFAAAFPYSDRSCYSDRRILGVCRRGLPLPRRRQSGVGSIHRGERHGGAA